MNTAEKLVEIAENIPKVYEAGKKAEYDVDWDNYQNNGKRTLYIGGFCGGFWDKNTLNPKYIVKPSGSSVGSAFMFMFCNNGNATIDFREIAHFFDFSNVTNTVQMFQDANFDYIEFDLSNVTSSSNMFAEGYFACVKKTITLTSTEQTVFSSNSFSGTAKLANLTFTEGSIIASSINLKDSPLTKESITSVINALSDTATGKTATFKKSAKEAAFTDAEWQALISTKQNWTIALA